MNDPINLIGGVTITVHVIAGRDFVAKDKTLFGRKKTTSDPFVIVRTANKKYGHTRTISKNCSPTWNETIKIELSTEEAQVFIQQCKQSNTSNNPSLKPTIDLCIMDDDLLSTSDPMGVVSVPVPLGTAIEQQWFQVTEGTGRFHCSNATGELQISVTTEILKIYNIQRGCVLNSNQIPNQQSRLTIGLSWDVENGQLIDLDTCCVAIDYSGNVLMNETVYCGNLNNSSLSVKLSGDELTGVKMGDDESIDLDLKRIPNNVLALYILLFVVGPPEQTFLGIKSAKLRIITTDTKQTLCHFIPSDMGTSNTALVLARIARCNNFSNEWTITPIADGDDHARDFGSLIPEIKGYTRDLIPNININPKERIAVMRKGGTIRVTDYLADNSIPAWLTFGLAWNLTRQLGSYGQDRDANSESVDIDASVILLDSNLQLIDTVWYGQKMSRDRSIVHGGDEREGDAYGDDEKIRLSLPNVSPNVTYIGLIVNSYSGQELDDVKMASCHLFDPRTNIDIATYKLTNCKALNHHTALIMGCLYRSSVVYDNSTIGSTDNSWYMRIISEPAHGNTVHDNVDELQRFLQRNPPQAPSVPPKPEVVLNAMPAPIIIEEEDIVVPMQEEEITLILE